MRSLAQSNGTGVLRRRVRTQTCTGERSHGDTGGRWLPTLQEERLQDSQDWKHFPRTALRESLSSHCGSQSWAVSLSHDHVTSAPRDRAQPLHLPPWTPRMHPPAVITLSALTSVSPSSGASLPTYIFLQEALPDHHAGGTLPSSQGASLPCSRRPLQPHTGAGEIITQVASVWASHRAELGLVPGTHASSS